MAHHIYEPEFKFDIDNGELDSFTDQQKFVLGFELGSIYAMIHAGVHINSLTFHTGNFGRVRSLFDKFEIIGEWEITDETWSRFEREYEQW